MTEIYRDSDVLVYPSYYEGFGYAILEAMAHGLAVIVSDIPSFRDMIIDGRNGFLVKPDDSSAMGRLISRLIGDKELLYQMKTESLKIVEDKFNPKLTAKTIERLLNKE